MDQTYYFIVNSKARTGKGIHIWEELEAVLKERNVNYKVYRTAHAGHAKELAEKMTSTDIHRNIVIVGGDGTVNEVINGIKDFSKVSFGYIPIGSANDLARGLQIHDKDPKELLNDMLEGNHSFTMDLGKTTDSNGKITYFAISSGIGIDAEVCKAALDSRLKKFLNFIHLGGLTYKMLTIHKLFTMPHVKSTLVLDDGMEQKVKKGIFVVGMNHPFEGGGVPMNPTANAMDGKLSLCCVSGYSRFRAFLVLPALLAAKHEGKKGFWLEDFKKAEIYLEKELVVHADGEYLGEHNHISLECIPGAMKFI